MKSSESSSDVRGAAIDALMHFGKFHSDLKALTEDHMLQPHRGSWSVNSHSVSECKSERGHSMPLKEVQIFTDSTAETGSAWMSPEKSKCTQACPGHLWAVPLFREWMTFLLLAWGIASGFRLTWWNAVLTSVSAPLCYNKSLCCAPRVCWGGRGAMGSRSKTMFKGPWSKC